MLASPDVRWWCSAVNEPWTGAWRAYPGVWLFTAVVAWAAWPRHGRPAGRATSAAGLALLWLALDWPLGALGASYLATAHAVQFFLLAMVVPPLLLRGVAPTLGATIGATLARRPAAARLLRAVTHPVGAMVAFTAVMVATHVPAVVDTLMRSPSGAFALDAAWFASGLAFWWPVICPTPARPRFGPPLRMLYLFFGTLAHLFIAMWLLLAEFPVYATYELAPPTGWVSPLVDQQLAGGVLLLVAGPYVLGVITLIFFRWFAREGGDGDLRGDLRGDPRATPSLSAAAAAGDLA